MTSKSKWFSHIVNHVPCVCLLRASDSCRFIRLSLVFVYFRSNAEKIEIVIVRKQIDMNLNFIGPPPKKRIFSDFWVFVLSPIPKSERSQIMKNPHFWVFSFKTEINKKQIQFNKSKVIRSS